MWKKMALVLIKAFVGLLVRSVVIPILTFLMDASSALPNAIAELIDSLEEPASWWPPVWDDASKEG